MENLKNILKDKEEKVAQLFVLIKEKGQENENIDNNESYLKMKVDELDKENQTLQDKINRYEKFLKNLESGEIDGNLKELRDSMTSKDKFNNAINKRRTNERRILRFNSSGQQASKRQNPQKNGGRKAQKRRRT